MAELGRDWNAMAALCARSAVESVHDGVLFVDGDARVRHLNPAAERLTGWSRAEALGRPVDEVVIIHGVDGAEPVSEQVRAVLGGEPAKPMGAGASLIARDGAALRIEQRITAACDEDRRSGAFVVLTDLSHGEHLQLLLARADRLASMGTMAASIAHEINNPLTYMMLNLASVSDTLAEEGRTHLIEALRDVEIGAHAIERIVRDLKLLSTPDLRVREAIEVAPILRRSQRMAAKAVRARGRFEASLPTTQPIFADPVALGQVVTNLVLNAAQALPDGYSEDSIVRLSCEDLGDAVLIEVTDNGCGISAEVMGRVFDPFFTTKPVGQGTGLGLAISHQIISDLNGSIEIDSEVGRGTRIRVILPTTSQVPDDVDVEEVTVRGGSWPVRHVLLIDDDAHVRRAIEARLRRVHRVSSVSSIDDAVQLLVKGIGYDAILCDVMMSPRNGLEILDELEVHAPDLLERTAFITGGVFTGTLQEEVLRSGRPVAYKPFRPEELLRLVEVLAQG